MASAPPIGTVPSFEHPLYTLEGNDRIIRMVTREQQQRQRQGEAQQDKDKPESSTQDEEEYQSLVEALSNYIRVYIRTRFGLLQQWIPSDDAAAKCDIFVSSDWDTAPKLLVILQNHVGSQVGMWSRSTCITKGLRAGSMIPFLEKAEKQGYAVIICNANQNSVVLPSVEGASSTKVPIQDSSFPEEHSMFVYENFVAQAQASHIFLFGYGNGAILCKEMLQRQIVRSQQNTGEANRITGIATVEASVMIQEDDSADVKAFLSRHAVDWEASLTLPAGHAITKTRTQLGVSQVLSVGTAAPGASEEEHVKSTAWSISAGIDSVFRFFEFCLDDSLTTPPQGVECTNSGSLHDNAYKSITAVTNRGHKFAIEEALRMGLPTPSTPTSSRQSMPNLFVASMSEQNGGESSRSPLNSNGTTNKGLSSMQQKDNSNSNSFIKRWRRMMSSSFNLSQSNTSAKGEIPSPAGDLNRSSSSESASSGCRNVALTETIAITDFDLLKVVGKGAFGKVMLVRKKAGPGAGKVYAMKVLNKDTIVKKGQIQHTMSERSILCEIRHPFIVRLRFAFQNETSLYLVTDFYTGGSLFYHLRKCNNFPEARAKYYAAELLLALEHLHSQFIIYRDLKLENILMDSGGHVALTDFGLSKQNVRTEACATTFCGTAEYLAPELLRGKPYGAPVDWWSFGILLYEMMDGKTPFYNKNRKYMFHCIVHVRPTFPPFFSQPAQTLILRLLEPDPARRFGSGERGAKEIREHEFFRDIDFDLLYRKKISPPFNPRVKSDMDIKFVPTSYHKLPPKESITEATGAGKCASTVFKSFTYHGDSHLG